MQNVAPEPAQRPAHLTPECGMGAGAHAEPDDSYSRALQLAGQRLPTFAGRDKG
jgi:hypothetical protein